ncbi:TatD family hydrolase [Niveibacterium terrae]|uniref:TatD family hydrolase n=1 Tax=Niveibacterium terrae TaxID=3373598 RepID=UPI003A94B85F
MLIDTHVHLDAPEFGNAEAVIARARAAGVGLFVVPSVAAANFSALDALAARHPEVRPAFGIHPLYIGQDQPEVALAALRARLERGGAVAVGEIGLDFHVEGLDRGRMEALYVAQLEMAKDFGLPVLLHLRRAQDQVLKHLRRLRPLGGIAHAFNGSRQQAEAFIALGFKLGFGGAMTYPGSTRIRELARSLPLEALVLETDGPDIPPAWRPEGPSLPEELTLYAQVLADLRSLPVTTIIEAVTSNARAALPALDRVAGAG